MKKDYLYLVALLFSGISFSQSVLLIDDFDTPSPQYTTSGDYFDSSTQYFGSTNDTDADVELGYSDITFFGARQLKNGNETISYNGIDITSLSNVSLAVGIAEDKGTGNTEDWDTGDAVHVEYRLDAGTWTNLFSIVASGATDTAPQIDTNNDGIGDGALITSNIDEFDFLISGLSATTIDFRLTFLGLTEAEEDIVFEYIAVVSDLNLFPEITITSPTPGQNFSNGTNSVDITYSITGNADSVVLIVNGDEGNPIAGNESGGTTSVPTTNNQSYEVEVWAYLDGVIVDDPDVYFEVGIPLSVDKTEIENFSVYPNPIIYGGFSIYTGSNSLKTMQLYDVSGKMVLSKQIQNNEVIHIGNLNSGMYILKVEENGKNATRKLVIN
ncbi:MAG: hypothetical protein COA88_09695 [Kordia sp.]|nr:MAG: hypothetical protein COA88_09695 [Kordia sp.]